MRKFCFREMVVRVNGNQRENMKYEISEREKR